MTREESADALELILLGEPNPIQIGAFMIAHRIRRPEPQELAGMVDTYLKLGPKIYSGNENRQPICFGMPFDGRKKTSPIYPLTSLLLLNAAQPVVLHGAGRLPVKYGITTKELFQALGLNLGNLTIEKVQEGFLDHGLALIYQPNHFALADTLTSYRENIAKRPPIASMELIWSAHRGKHLLISGFVHPPTEKRHLKTLEMLNEDNIVLVQGLEGSIDISTSRITKITSVHKQQLNEFKINPKNYFCNSKDIEFENIETWKAQSLKALEGTGSLYKALLLNAGVYFWFAGIANNVNEGIEQAKLSIASGSVQQTLQKLITWTKKNNF